MLGFALSAVVQAAVSKQQMSRLLPDDRPRSIATALGATSSSCCYAAVALARSIFRKGAHFAAAMAFEMASTNLVLELGLIVLVLLGWQFTLAEFLGSPLMVLLFRMFLGRDLLEQAKEQADKGIAGRMDIQAYRSRLHYVGHQDGIKPGLTARETLVFWAALRGRQAAGEAPAAAAALRAFALDAIADWPCRWLSAGQRRRLALARLVVTKAPVWLLDEPTSALDEDNQQRLERVIAEHRAAGGRAVVASHTAINLGACATLCLDAFAPLPSDPHAF
jgi:heme ABC exporter ATP-binding subunit CcmA